MNKETAIDEVVANRGRQTKITRRSFPLTVFKLRWGETIPILIMTAILVCAVFAAWLAPSDPVAVDLKGRLIPPLGFDGSTFAHILGTDELGRDVLSRLIYGARTSAIVGIMAVLLSGSIGITVGVISGFIGGKVDIVIMRLLDTQISIPPVLLAIALVGATGGGLANVIIVIGIVGWTTYARIARAETLTLKEREFVALAKVAGAGRLRILRKHVLPNIANSVVVLATLQLGGAIIMEASLSFLGLGVQPPSPAWGSMLSAGGKYIVVAWWLCVFPGLAIMFTVLAANLLGDNLRDRWDPRLRQL